MPSSPLPLSAEGKPMIGIVTGATVARGLDHLVIAVRDLDMAAGFYERLGFQVGARNRHPWGTENRLVQFPGSFLELVTVLPNTNVPPHGDRQFSFGAFVQSALVRAEGLCMLALDSIDAVADAASFSTSGIGHFESFFFERQGARPDGSPMRVAFTLAFARDEAAPGCGFFTCQHHEPGNFWNPAFQSHANGASAISAVMMAAENPSDHHIFLEAFTGQRGPRSSSLGLSLGLARGRLEVLTPQAALMQLGETAGDNRDTTRFLGFAVTVPDMAATAAHLAAAGIPARQIGPRLVIPGHAAFGTAIIFEPET